MQERSQTQACYTKRDVKLANGELVFLETKHKQTKLLNSIVYMFITVT